MSADPVSPSLKDLPNINNDLKSQLLSFNQDKLKDVNVNEKIVLPTAQGMAIFRDKNNMFTAVVQSWENQLLPI